MPTEVESWRSRPCNGAAIVRGEAGVGKSALLEYAREAATGFTVLESRGLEGEAELAFAGLHQLCAPFVDRLERLPGPQCEAIGTAFGLRERPFHFEMFRTRDRGLVPLEVNMRPPGGLTVDMFNYANDFDFEGIFARQVQALGRKGDVLLGISTSGSSKNVVRAAADKGLPLTAGVGHDHGDVSEVGAVAHRRFDPDLGGDAADGERDDPQVAQGHVEEGPLEGAHGDLVGDRLAR